MNERKLIKVKITDIDEHNLLDCSIDDAIMHLESIQRLYMGQGFKELELKTHSYGYDGAFEIYLYGKRLETDREVSDRLKKEEKEALAKKKAEDKKQAEELKLYKKLKKKFGDV